MLNFLGKNKHKKVLAKNCRGRKPVNIDPEQYLYWCPNQMSWLTQKCNCEGATQKSKDKYVINQQH